MVLEGSLGEIGAFSRLSPDMDLGLGSLLNTPLQNSGYTVEPI